MTAEDLKSMCHDEEMKELVKEITQHSASKRVVDKVKEVPQKNSTTNTLFI